MERLCSADFAALLGFEKRRNFLKAYFTHKIIYAYLLLFMGTWNMQEYWDSDIFWLGDS